MRLRSNLANADELQEFTDGIHKIGDEKLEGPNAEHAIIDIPQDLLIKETYDLTIVSVDCTYSRIREGPTNSSYFHKRAILVPNYQ